MKNKTIAPSVPTVNLCVNKSRIKLYHKSGEIPTYYLKKGQEFQFELFNPTSDVILAKIYLNSKAISQGGLILNPGQRVFLDRYLDVAQKFLFDTYEVSNTVEVKKAIEKNGDIKVEFYKEQQYYKPIPTLKRPWAQQDWIYYGTGNLGSYSIGTNYMSTNPLNISTSSSNTTLYTSNLSYSNDISQKNLLFEDSLTTKQIKAKKCSKSIETGIVEMGSHSNQEFEYVNKDFAYFPFHTVEYKLLPVSQKVNTVDDINIKRYCTNCGHKLGKTDKFCGQCGTKC